MVVSGAEDRPASGARLAGAWPPETAVVRRPAPARTAVLGAVLTALLTVPLLAGCSGGSSGSSAGSSVAQATGSAGAPAGGGAATGKAVAAPLPGRDVVRTATMAVRVSEVRSAADRARGAAEQAGGALESEDDRSGSGGEDVLRLRVPPARLPATLDGLAALGQETARSVGSEDVTGQVVDLQSRLATQRASVERVRALLGSATALADVVTLERELADREGALESLQAQAKALQGQVDLATVTLTLSPLAAVAASAAGFGDGLSAGVDAFRATGRVAAVALGGALPFLPLLALGAWGARRLTRRGAPARTG